MIILTVTSVPIFVPLKNQIELQKHYSGVDHQLPHSSSEPGPTSYSEIRSSQFRQSKRSLRASFDIDSILTTVEEGERSNIIVISCKIRFKYEHFSSIFEYLRKLIRNARRSMNSKIEGAKMIRTLLGSSIYEIHSDMAR